MSKIIIVIVDGVGYRNFVLSDFFNKLKDASNEVVIFSGLKKEVFSSSIFDSMKIVELDIYKESKISWVFRKAKELAHLQRNKGSIAIHNNLNNRKPNGLGLKAIIIRFLLLWTSVFNSEYWISIYYKLQVISFRRGSCYKSYYEILKENRCDLIFFTHQRPPFLALLYDASKKNKIKAVSFIFSWDNISSKGRMAAPFDYFFVWSNLMKRELLQFYPKVKSKSIYIVGTPQFEPYILDKYQIEKNLFFKKFKLNKVNKTIYYSCGDVSTSKLDPLYIETIANLIKNNKINEPVNFIVRTSPAEDNKRFLNVQEKFPFIKWNFPKWKLTRKDHTESWSQRVPEEEDIVDLRGLLESCDLNINMCSTMSLDFMLFDKPVINIVFGNEFNGLYNDQKYLKYNHYEKVVKSGAITIAKNELELCQQINEALKNPKKNKKEREQILDLEIGAPLKGTSKRIVKALKELA